MKTSNGSSSNRRILLVDDDRLILNSIVLCLQGADYVVVTAESVDDAEAILSGGDRPALIIIDVNMPNRNGLELSKRLHSLDQIPFIMLSGCTDQQLVDQAIAYGALGYLVKPVNKAQLLPAVEAALSRAKEIEKLKTTSYQLQKALDAEREISIAIGITMVQHRVDRTSAFELLRKTARCRQRKLAELAAEVIYASEVLTFGGSK